MFRNSLNERDAEPTRLRFRCFFLVCDLWKTWMTSFVVDLTEWLWHEQV